uniref:CACN subunit beta associated regulatory protein b n=1 Tax=Amphilophus citrinellus TaxID=61819 RepID=A0A3Q0SFQ0_AMPCI
MVASHQDVPVSAGQVENYVLLLVLLSVFAGGTLVLISLLLLFCHRCCMGGRRFSAHTRSELCKFFTCTCFVYLVTMSSITPIISLLLLCPCCLCHSEITIRLDESDGLSASSCHDGESERFVSTGSTGRRVSFNESALYEQERTTQDKGRRYTLTEGDFHHLKKARLTHLHLPPAPCDLKILTIMECDSTESSTINISETAAPKLPLTIYQVRMTSHRVSGGLPGDPHHSVILDEEPRRSLSMEAIDDRGEAESEMSQAMGQGSVLHFFSKLRRHASLEGAGPYFRRWKFDTTHRAASLDAKGSPKRRPFQRQRAASETTDHTEDDSSPLQDEAVESFPHTPIQTGGLQSLSAESLSHPQTAPASSVVLGAEARQRTDSGSSLSFMLRQESLEVPPSLYRDIWSLRASLELYASSDQSSTDRESIRSDADSTSSLGGAGTRSGLDKSEGGNRKLLQMDSGYASIELMSPLVKTIPQPTSPHRTRLRRRDYSIDEKTDALFNEFLRHDPRFDQQDSPLRSRHRSRVHLRKQWQRHKQYSDPGSSSGGRYSPSLERQRFTPLRRGDSAGYPLDTRYHSTLSRIASAADEEASEVAASEEAAKERQESTDPLHEGAAEESPQNVANKTSEEADATKSNSCSAASAGETDGCQVSADWDTESTTCQSETTVPAQMGFMDPRVDNKNNNSSQAILSEVSLQAESSLTDKLAVSVEERLYSGLRSAEISQGESEHVLTVSHTASPGFNPM